MFSTAARAKTARCRACWKFSAFPTLIRACSLRRSPCRRTWLRTFFAPPPCRCRRGWGLFTLTRAPGPPPQELFREDWTYGDRVIVEKYIAGKELTCAVVGEQALGVIEIVPAVRFYDYEAKYAPGGSKHLLPAPVSSFVYQQVRRLALAAHQALGCRGVSRTDFRFDDRIEGAGGLVCLEVNTQPGMTETSLVPELAEYAGVGFEELVRWMVEDASLNR